MATVNLFIRSTRWTRWLVVAVHVAFIVPASQLAVIEVGGRFRWPWDWTEGAVTLALGLVLLAIQLRLSLAFGAGQRLHGAPWLLIAIAIVVYVPMIWLGWAWSWMQACLMASAAMVLRRRFAILVIGAILVGSSFLEMRVWASQSASLSLTAGIFWIVYVVISFGVPAAGMYGSARLVALVDALRDARAELAAAAVDQERRRFARDLHDLLGQSLSAISLKGDLAIRLMASNPAMAGAEIKSLTDLARGAVRGIRAVSRDQRSVSLREETEGAVALLAAAGVNTRLSFDLSDLTPRQESLLAWAVREGVANTIRHSEARSCSITGQRRDGKLVLEIVNDGASGPMGEGTGLAGLAERARVLAGSASGGRTEAGEFRLLVEVPESTS